MVAIDSTNIYFTTGTDGHVDRCPLAGCPAFTAPTQVLSGFKNANALYYDVANAVLYVSDSGNNTITAATTGGATIWSITGESSVFNFATDGTLLYWSASSGIRYTNKAAGGPAATLAGGIVGPTGGIWYDPTSQSLYAAEPNNSGHVDQCKGGSCNFIAPTTTVQFFNPQAVIVVGSTIYFGTGGSAAPDGLFSAPVANPVGNVTPVANGGNYVQPIGLTADSTRVYFAPSVSMGNIYACGLNGCPGGPVLIASNTGAVFSMANDAQHVYWGNGNIWRVAK